jgi:phage antirepressor YoqD-like protein
MNIHDDAKKQRELQEERRRQLVKKKPHIEYYDKLYNAQLALEAAIGAVEMYQSHETTFMAHLHAVKEMLEARIINE